MALKEERRRVPTVQMKAQTKEDRPKRWRRSSSGRWSALRAVGARVGRIAPLTIFGFLAGRASVFGLLSPFGPSVLALALLREPAAMVPVILAVAASSFSWPIGAKMIETLLIIGLLPLAFTAFRQDYRERARRDAIPIAALLFGVSVIVRGVSAVIRSSAPMNLVVAFVESLLAAVLTGALYSGWGALQRMGDRRRAGEARALSQEESFSVALLFATAAAGLSGLSVGQVQLEQVFSGLVIMAFALSAGSGAGAAAGAVIGAVTTMSAGLSVLAVGGSALAGLVTGFFGELGRVGVGLAYVACQALLGFVGYGVGSGTGNVAAAIISRSGVGAGAGGLSGVGDLGVALLPPLVAAGLFMLLAPSLGALSGAFVAPPAVPGARGRGGTAPGGGQKPDEGPTEAAGRLRHLAEVFRELELSFEQIASTEPAPEDPDANRTFNLLASRVCEPCILRKTCWDKEFNKTYRAVLDLLAACETKDGVSREDLPENLQRRCLHLDKLVATINHLFELNRANLLWQRRLGETKNIVIGQLRGMTGVIEAIAAELEWKHSAEDHDRRIETLRAALATAGAETQEVALDQRADGRDEVVLTRTPCRDRQDCAEHMVPALSRALGQRLSLVGGPCPRRGESFCRLKLSPTRLVSYRHGAANRPGTPGHSGDTNVAVELEDGRLVLMISDGMGKGERAAMESRTTVRLLEQLIAAGFDTRTAVTTVNSILVTRSPEEITSTVDLAVVDLFTAEAQFVKVGAAPSYLIRGGEVTVLSASSLPLGILPSVDLEQSSRQLHPGDIVVLISDGILGPAKDQGRREGWLVKTLRTIAADPAVAPDPQAIANRLLEKAATFADSEADDMTAVVARFDAAG